MKFRLGTLCNLLLVVSVICFIFISIQLVLYFWIHNGYEVAETSNIDPSPRNKRYGGSSAYTALRAFMRVCERHLIPIILVDVPVLQTVVGGHRRVNTTCRVLCTDQNLTVFAVLADLWIHKDATVRDWADQGFKVFIVTQDIQWKNPTHCRVRTHYVLQHKEHLLHLVVLFSRLDAHVLWHGSLTAAESEGLLTSQHSKQLATYGEHEGIIESFENVKVTLDGLRVRFPRYPDRFIRNVLQSHFIECNSERAKQFYAQYGALIQTEETEVFREMVQSTLATAKQVLEGLDIPFWLSSGTCLGWFRQCDVISYNGDMDLGIWIKDYNEDLTSAMSAAGLPLKHSFGKVNDSFELSFYAGHIKLDIFFFYEDQNDMWNGGTQARTGNKYKYVFPKFKLCWTIFLNMNVRVPCDTITYIKANYGDNWFDPVKQWDWKSSPPNVKPNGVWPQEEWNLVIQSY